MGIKKDIKQMKISTHNKIIVSDTIEFDEKELFVGSIESVARKLIDLKEQYTDKYINLLMDIFYDYDGYQINIHGTRLETDEEYKNRINEIKRNKQKERNKKEAEKRSKEREDIIKHAITEIKKSTGCNEQQIKEILNKRK
jgi:hypothetical protein